MQTDLILGTAGHIDHGKTALIRALTGDDLDRLPEEKQRGITIELGFTHLDLAEYRLGIVDVPGHERFVRTMLAGATGIDVALLVVAADDSIKPQTREHLEILKLLRLDSGVIAITKCDLVESGWVELVEEEIRELVADTFLADAPLIRVSSLTGQGIDTLRDALLGAAEQAARSRAGRSTDAPFRMAIDRCFTIAGYGTVVTGSVSSGRAAVGQELAIEPGNLSVRIRGLQNHERTVEEIHRGQRAAINLAGVHHAQIRRGHELATPGHLVPSRLITTWLSLLESAPRPLKHRTRVRVHVGTAELLGTVALLDREQLKPGEAGPAQLFLNEWAVTTWSQPLVVRSESPVVTIGGGRVLDPNAQRLRTPDAAVIGLVQDLSSLDPLRRAAAACYFAGLRDWQPQDLARTAGIENPAEIYARLLAQGEVREIAVSPTRIRRVHRLVLEQLSDRVAATMHKLHEQNPLRSKLDREQLRTAFRYVDPTVLDTVLNDMRAAGRIRVDERGLTLEGHGPKLSQNERKLLRDLIQMFQEAGIQAPSVAECQKQTGKPPQTVSQLLALAAADGELVEIGANSYLHREVDQTLQAALRAELGGGDGATLSQIREILGTTRKYAVPYCEYLDRIGFTRRAGDLRILADAPA
jgi:selenocysteine-specific elongation factor